MATWTPAIIIHTIAAFAAVLLGAWVFFRRKGTTNHRIGGRIWAGLMLVVVFSSFFITSNGRFSWIHLLSIYTFFALAYAIWLAREKQVIRHRRNMISLYLGSLVIAGAFTLLPGRLLGHALYSFLGIA